MKIQIKSILCFVLVFMCMATCYTPAFAANETSWYFKKNSEHKQPKLDVSQEFIKNYKCYYLNEKSLDDDSEKVIYLTFDAGYENGNVEKILDILKEKDVKGAFFILGHLLTANTELVKRMGDEGHMICNHTMTHKNMASVTNKAEFKKELSTLETLYKEKTGRELAKYYRPPEGRFSENNLKILEELGYKTVLWSFAYADWDNSKQPNAEASLNRLLDGTHNGEILLLHPTSSTNAEILGRFIDALKEQGFRFGTLDEL